MRNTKKTFLALPGSKLTGKVFFVNIKFRTFNYTDKLKLLFQLKGVESLFQSRYHQQSHFQIIFHWSIFIFSSEQHPDCVVLCLKYFYSDGITAYT